MDKNSWYQMIPKVDRLLEQTEIVEAIAEYGRSPVIKVVREQLELVRTMLVDCQGEKEVKALIDSLSDKIIAALKEQAKYNLKRVINATGVILHTNLGRAVIHPSHMERLSGILTGYTNLEFNLLEGKRGERYSHFEDIVCNITGAEAAIAVNNNAAAVLLMISALCQGKEVIVSRGEQVEIGGKFRIPDVILQSGAGLIEVGTTNRTRRSDYEDAITENTGALLKVHTSNYKITGFTESVSVTELAGLSIKYGIPFIEDLGSGVLIDLSKYGLSKEPTVSESLQQGADLVSFSGDKLLGGPQAGIIAGKKKYIDILKKHPLMRAVRIDKYTAALLEMTFACYKDDKTAITQIPILFMMTRPVEAVLCDANTLLHLLEPLKKHYSIQLVDCSSTCGGGAMPGESIPSKGIAISGERLKPNEAEEEMRRLETPIIIRTQNDQLLLDMRTVLKEDIQLLAEGLIEILIDHCKS